MGNSKKNQIDLRSIPIYRRNVDLFETISPPNKAEFLVQLKHNSIIPWSLAENLLDLSLSASVSYSFGVAKGIDIGLHPIYSEIANQFNLKTRIFVIHMPAEFHALPIHIDGHADKNNAASIIWPLYGCDERSPTKWFETKTHEFEFVKNNYFLKNAEGLKVCHSQSMHSSEKSPYLFRSNILHCGYNFSGKEKIIVKWEMNSPNWTEANEFFRTLDLIA